MLKKRLVGVITVKDGRAVQSFGYRRWLPLGRPEVLAENLDRWGVDEILVSCIDRSSGGLGPDLALLRRLGALGLSTPLAYGGGIRTVADAGAVVKAGAERVCVDAALRGDLAVIRGMARLLGAQAVIASLPMQVEGGRGLWYDYRARAAVPLPPEFGALFSDSVSEALVVDWRNEGGVNAFDEELVAAFPLKEVPLIAFGGVTEPAQVSALLSDPRVAAVGVGNSLSYREHAVQSLKARAAGTELRPPSYAA